MLTQQTWRRAARAAAATGFATVLALGGVGAAHAGPGGQGSPPPHAAAESGPPGHAASPATPAAPPAGAGSGGHTPGTKPSKPAGADKPTKAPTSAKPAKPAKPAKRKPVKAGAQGQAAGNGHTPVTVCHRLGNGGYHLLTFDDNALAAHVRHGDLHPVPAGGCPGAPAAEESPSAAPAKPDRERGTTRVTVCHVLGHGGYHLLTFDDDALDAHVRHGDLHPVPEGGCPAPTAETPVVPGSTSGGETPTTSAPGQPLPGLTAPVVTAPVVTAPGTIAPEAPTGMVPVVAGVEQHADSSTAVVGGVEQTASGSPGVSRVAPVAGVLPQTGADRFGALLALGAGLVGGGVLLARRRTVTG